MAEAPAPATRPLKVVGVASFMNVAGAQEALVRVARRLRARGHETEVVFLYEEAPAFAGEPHVSVLTQKPKLSPAEYVSTFLKLRRWLIAARPDAVLGFLPLGAVFGALAAWSAGVKVRIASQRAPGPTFGRAMRLLDRLWGTLGVYTRIVCVSDAVLHSFDDYPKAYRDKLSVVHNGIEWTPSPLSREEARARFGLPQDALVLLALGRMKTQKNYLYLLERVAETPGVLLVVGGDGELRPQVEAKIAELGISDRVRLLGNVEREGVNALYAASDVFVMSSLYEGQSNAVLEAMNAGLPMVVSDIPMNRETPVDAEGSETGVLAPLDRPDVWLAGLARLRDDAAERARLGAAAQALVQRRFSLDAMIDGFERAILADLERTR